MTPQQAQNAIKAQIVLATRGPASAVVWDGEARPFASDPFVLLKWSTAKSTHDRVTEIVIPSGPDAGNKTTVYDASTDITVQVRVETTNAGGSMNAFAMAERIRIAAWRPNVSPFHKGETVQWIRALGGIVPLDYKIDGRDICAFSVDILFRAILSDEPSGDKTGIIETVKVHGSVTAGAETFTTDQTIQEP